MIYALLIMAFCCSISVVIPHGLQELIGKPEIAATAPPAPSVPLRKQCNSQVVGSRPEFSTARIRRDSTEGSISDRRSKAKFRRLQRLKYLQSLRNGAASGNSPLIVNEPWPYISHSFIRRKEKVPPFRHYQQFYSETDPTATPSGTPLPSGPPPLESAISPNSFVNDNIPSSTHARELPVNAEMARQEGSHSESSQYKTEKPLKMAPIDDNTKDFVLEVPPINSGDTAGMKPLERWINEDNEHIEFNNKENKFRNGQVETEFHRMPPDHASRASSVSRINHNLRKDDRSKISLEKLMSLKSYQSQLKDKKSSFLRNGNPPDGSNMIDDNFLNVPQIQSSDVSSNLNTEVIETSADQLQVNETSLLTGHNMIQEIREIVYNPNEQIQTPNYIRQNAIPHIDSRELKKHEALNVENQDSHVTEAVNFNEDDTISSSSKNVTADITTYFRGESGSHPGHGDFLSLSQPILTDDLSNTTYFDSEYYTNDSKYNSSEQYSYSDPINFDYSSTFKHIIEIPVIIRSTERVSSNKLNIFQEEFSQESMKDLYPDTGISHVQFVNSGLNDTSLNDNSFSSNDVHDSLGTLTNSENKKQFLHSKRFQHEIKNGTIRKVHEFNSSSPTVRLQSNFQQLHRSEDGSVYITEVLIPPVETYFPETEVPKRKPEGVLVMVETNTSSTFQKHGKPLEPGEDIPGMPGYVVPTGFRGRVVLGYNKFPINISSKKVVKGFNTFVRLQPPTSEHMYPIYGYVSGPGSTKYLTSRTNPALYVSLSSGADSVPFKGRSPAAVSGKERNMKYLRKSRPRISQNYSSWTGPRGQGTHSRSPQSTRSSWFGSHIDKKNVYDSRSHSSLCSEEKIHCKIVKGKEEVKLCRPIYIEIPCCC